MHQLLLLFCRSDVRSKLFGLVHVMLRLFQPLLRFEQKKRLPLVEKALVYHELLS